MVGMPHFQVEHIQWDDANLLHATRHGVSADEINQVIANNPLYRANKKLRAGDYSTIGVTDGGRRVELKVKWYPATRTIRPITAWEAS